MLNRGGGGCGQRSLGRGLQRREGEEQIQGEREKEKDRQDKDDLKQKRSMRPVVMTPHSPKRTHMPQSDKKTTTTPQHPLFTSQEHVCPDTRRHLTPCSVWPAQCPSWLLERTALTSDTNGEKKRKKGKATEQRSKNKQLRQKTNGEGTKEGQKKRTKQNAEAEWRLDFVFFLLFFQLGLGWAHHLLKLGAGDAYD